MSQQLGTAIGGLERASREAIKTLRRAPGPSAVEALDRVRVATDRVLRLLVAEMRDAGATWEDVGDAFGISRQAAWERFRG